MSRTSDGRDTRKAAARTPPPKHRNLLPDYHGPVPVGDEDNLRGFPMIIQPGR